LRGEQDRFGALLERSSRKAAPKWPILSIVRLVWSNRNESGQEVVDLEHDPEKWKRFSEKIMLKTIR